MIPDDSRPRFGRVLLKLSGEAFSGEQGYGISPETIKKIANEIAEVAASGVQVAIVVGGGNILRGSAVSAGEGMERTSADYAGMLATVINAVALQDSLEKLDVQTRVQTAIPIPQIAEPFIRRRAMRHMEKGRVVIFGAGTGNPYFTTDSAASLRAIEINADVILKGTRVDGIYTADPEKDPTATKFDVITFEDAYSRGLKVMDMTAFTLCMENDLPIIVFDMDTAGNLRRLMEGEQVGTIVQN